MDIFQHSFLEYCFEINKIKYSLKYVIPIFTEYTYFVKIVLKHPQKLFLF